MSECTVKSPLPAISIYNFNLLMGLTILFAINTAIIPPNNIINNPLDNVVYKIDLLDDAKSS